MTTSEKQANYLGPFLTMVFLFFIVGFLTTVNTQFQAPLKSVFLSNVGQLKNTLATLITFSWFLSYPLCGSVGSSWINARGYKVTLLRGLMVMTAGLLLFFASSWFTVQWPTVGWLVGDSFIPGGFVIFLFGSFVTGASATILQVVLNPYLSACSVRGTQSVQRLAIGGSANSVGTTIAPFFVSGVVFSGLSMNEITVGQLILPFSLLAAVILLVLLVLTRLSLPDIPGTRNDEGTKLERSIWSFHHLTLGVVAIFFYVGVEVCIGANINMYALEMNYPAQDVALMATLYWGGMLIGRLAGSTLNKISPRTQLTFTTICASLILIGAVTTHNPYILAGAGLFHSIMWGAIFTLSVTGLGRYTSVASGVFMIGVVGGAILPLIQGILADMAGSWQWTWYMVLLGEVYMLYYAQIGSRPRKGDWDTGITN